jgi:hypothetical protein
MNLPCKYPYNPSFTFLIGGGLLCAIGAVFMGHEAMTNDKGLIIDYVIRLGVEGATAFYWFIAGCMGFGAGLLLVYLVRRFTNPGVLVLDVQGISLPYMFAERRVPYASITSLQEYETSSQTMLYIRTREGKVVLHKNWLPDGQTYDAIKSFLASRAGK